MMLESVCLLPCSFRSSLITRINSRRSGFVTKRSVANLGEGYGGPGPPPPLFWVKREEITEGRKAGRASKQNRALPLTQGLDPPPVKLNL